MDQVEYVTKEELEEVRANLTMLDVYRARKIAGQDRADVGMRATWYAARRVLDLPSRESADTQEAYEAFMGRIRAEDFNRVQAAPATPLVDGGESGPGSSGSTDSPPASSSS